VRQALGVCCAASHLDRKLLAGTNELLKTHQHAAKFRPNTMLPTFGGRKALKINRAAKPPQKLILLPKAERGGSDAGTKGSAARGPLCPPGALRRVRGGCEGRFSFGPAGFLHGKSRILDFETPDMQPIMTSAILQRFTNGSKILQYESKCHNV